MKRVTRNGVIAVAAASGAMAMTLPAFADSGADALAAGSPGVVSGNNVQVPVHIPLNLCGNTVSVVGALNPAFGNTCVNKGSRTETAEGTAQNSGGSAASSVTKGSPGAVSGNGLQLPVDLPVNASGNSVNPGGVLNPTFGNTSVNGTDEEQPPRAEPKPEPPVRHTPPAASQPGPTKAVPPARAPQAPQPKPHSVAPRTEASLAETGAGTTAAALAGSAALVLGGAVLYRRYRPAAGR
ncbi:chaplin family protein [Streptomyces sp. NPDC002132]|uniref:chaplin family protein n=1 Tax=Streptomyces sp. NPDC002132 TaxID=3154408 RepID=UPI00332747BB